MNARNRDSWRTNTNGNPPIHASSSDIGTTCLAEANRCKNVINELLHSQINDLRTERDALQRTLNARNQQLEECRKQWERDKSDLTGSRVDSVATKIIELSRRNRCLTAELEAERTRCRSFQRAKEELENASAARQQTEQTEKEQPREKYASMTEEDISKLKDKLHSTTRRMFEHKSTSERLKLQLANTRHLLQQEVGVEPSAGWRGRAQQIITLKAQVAELQQKVKQETQIPVKSAPSLVDTRVSAHLKNLAEQQQSQIQQVKDKVRTLSEQNVEIKRKFEASRARSQTLLRQLSEAREQVSRLSEKGRNDDELIDVLLREKRERDQTESDETKQQAKSFVSEHSLLSDVQQQLVRERAKNQQLEKILKLKERRIEELQTQSEESGGEH